MENIKTTNPNGQIRRNRKKSPISKIEYAIVGFCAFAVLMFIISNYVQLSTLTTQNSRMKSQLETLVDDEKGLIAKQERLFDLNEIENKAKNEYGMIKLDKSQICYIEVESPEKITIADKNAEVPSIVKNAIKSFNIVVEYLN